MYYRPRSSAGLKTLVLHPFLNLGLISVRASLEASVPAELSMRTGWHASLCAQTLHFWKRDTLNADTEPKLDNVAPRVIPQILCEPLGSLQYGLCCPGSKWGEALEVLKDSPGRCSRVWSPCFSLPHSPSRSLALSLALWLSLSLSLSLALSLALSLSLSLLLAFLPVRADRSKSK